MTASNHTVTGAVFAALTVSTLPVWVILPLAFLLHFVLDALPHFGQVDDEAAALRRLKWLLPLDASIAALVLLIIAIVQPAHWQLMIAAGILSASPDLWSFTRYQRFLHSGNTAYNDDWFAQFHHKIQWGERIWGFWIEIPWFFVFGYVLITKL